MGWKGTMRSVGAAMRAAERDAQRRHTSALKAQLVADAQAAVTDWETYIDELLTIHVNLADEFDWNALAAKQEPGKPVKKTVHEAKAKEALSSFKPGVMDKLLGATGKKRAGFESNLAMAPELDERDYRQDIKHYEEALAEWKSDTDLARRLIAGENDAVLQVIREYQSMSEESLIGQSVKFTVDGQYIHAAALVHSDEIIPSTRRKQLASGKLSETKMPAGQFNELYQDYVCSVALKIAGDLFRMLPQQEIYVTCETEMLDTATGYKKSTPILSVQFVQQTFMALNLRSIDPSDSMANFNHRMSFNKTRGFAPVEPYSYVKLSD